MPLFLVKVDVSPPATMSARQLAEIWDREAQAALQAIEAGVIKGLWKVAGQRTVFGVLDLPDADVLHQAIMGLPIMQEMGPSVHWQVWPVRPYENFAADLRKMVSES